MFLPKLKSLHNVKRVEGRGKVHRRVREVERVHLNSYLA